MADLPVPSPTDPAMPGPYQPATQVPAALQIVQQPALNWSQCRPKFTGKPEEGIEAHLLCTNDWMNTQNFSGDVRLQRLCLTFVGEARLWYGSLRSITNDMQAFARTI